MDEPLLKRARNEQKCTATSSETASGDKWPAGEELCSGGDLSVHVEGAILVVHSLILALASPVFKAMLGSGMQEGLGKEIFLKGKSKEEFVHFWRLLQPGNFEPVTQENVHCLLRWADEYQVEGLKSRCEEHLVVKEVPQEPAALDSALKEAFIYRLEQRREQLLGLVKKDMVRYLGSLPCIAPESAELLRGIWPEICAASGVVLQKRSDCQVEAKELQADPSSLAPVSQHIVQMWPFVAAATRPQTGETLSGIAACLGRLAQAPGDSPRAFPTCLGAAQSKQRISVWASGALPQRLSDEINAASAALFYIFCV
ncbi:unnamed protein product [Polarella glacialis]|uniref:BTB domain-containing protein n=1 Tax=Polarella glacialis TaxID=89957 RepID=A0A813FMX1_POLGL|nr:unnamed protein product [Polarella glacialis]